jgi:23S rRNA pseudouridine2605 synthase
VRLDGRTLVPIREEKIYIMLYKPDNVVTTMKDREGRKTAPALIGELSSRVFPIGRLDFHTTGLLLLTNDGDFAYRLTHPRFGVEKTYVAKLMSVPRPSELNVLRRGLPIEGKMTNPAQANFLEKKGGKGLGEAAHRGRQVPPGAQDVRSHRPSRDQAAPRRGSERWSSPGSSRGSGATSRRRKCGT